MGKSPAMVDVTGQLVPTVRMVRGRDGLPWYEAAAWVERDGAWAKISAMGATPGAAEDALRSELAAWLLTRDDLPEPELSQEQANAWSAAGSGRRS